MNLYKITVSKGRLLGTYDYYVVAESFAEAEKQRRPADWSSGKIIKIAKMEDPVLAEVE